jgi:hypothetical protein
MMTIDEIRDALEDRNIKKVAEAIHASYYALRQIKAGKAQRPSHAVVVALSDYLEGRKAA